MLISVLKFGRGKDTNYTYAHVRKIFYRIYNVYYTYKSSIYAI